MLICLAADGGQAQGLPCIMSSRIDERCLSSVLMVCRGRPDRLSPPSWLTSVSYVPQLNTIMKLGSGFNRVVLSDKGCAER